MDPSLLQNTTKKYDSIYYYFFQVTQFIIIFQVTFDFIIIFSGQQKKFQVTQFIIIFFFKNT